MTYDGRWETVRVSAEEHIAWVELRRPEKRNAMKPKLSRSGGEWISSTELESHLARQPAVAEAAVIATVDEQWDERPLDVLVGAAGQHIDVDAVRSALAREVARWWGPECIEVLAGLPTTSVGKVDKPASALALHARRVGEIMLARWRAGRRVALRGRRRSG